jgi:hypothetical protein
MNGFALIVSCLAVATGAIAKEVGTCGPTSPSTVQDCLNVDSGSCANACCGLQFLVDEDPLTAMQKLNASFAEGGADGSYTLQMTAEKTLGFGDLRPFHAPGGEQFLGQVHHKTTGGYVDEVDISIRPKQCTGAGMSIDCNGEGSIIRAFSTSLIAGALGDNGQNYKNIVMAMKNVAWKTPFQQSQSDGSCPTPTQMV